MASNVVYQDDLISLTRIETVSNEKNQKLFHCPGTPYLQVCVLKPQKIAKDSFVFRRHELRSIITNLNRVLKKFKSDEEEEKKYKRAIRYIEESLKILEKELKLFRALFSISPDENEYIENNQGDKNASK